MPISASYDPRLVALSVVIASLASYVALDLAGRTTAARSHARFAWLAGGSFVMGVGIWSMHFIGMLAFGLRQGVTELQIGYHDVELIGSVLVAIAASALALGVASRPHLTIKALLGAGLLMGGAIAGMHYLGMAAMRMPAVLSYDPTLVVVSIAIAIAASIVALTLARRLGETRSAAERWAKRAAAGVMGVAIAGMHYTAMAAAHFRAPTHDTSLSIGSVVATSGLAVVVTAAALVVLTAGLLGVALDRQHGRHLQAGEVRYRSLSESAEAALRESEQRFRNVVEQSPEAIVLHAAGVMLYANPAAGALIGAGDTSSFAGTPFGDLLHPDSRELWARGTTPARGIARHETVEFRILHRDGRVLDVEARSVPATLNGEPAVQTHLRDVTAQKALEAQLAHQAFHDALTNLANRALFRDRVDHALARAARRGTPPAVLFLDLDNFKSVNDGLGHSAGDELLCIIARRLGGVMRPSDTCARLGGDEFAILIDDSGDWGDIAATAAHMAERVIAAFKVACTVGSTEVVVTVSVGIAVAHRHENAEDLLRNADVAMYRAKSRGKGRYEVFEPAMHEAVRRRLELETELRRAVDSCTRPDREADAVPFVLHFQPIASLRNAQIRGFEALVRWRHADRGMVAPLDFIPIAEETGLIIPLGRWILREACVQARRWQSQGLNGVAAGGIGVTVNLSARQLTQADLARDVAEALERTGLRAEHLTIEVTESMLMDDSAATLARLRALKSLGVRLAIDDFGTGYSSLGYLERFPVDVLKIDRSFVEHIGRGESESPLARAILSLGRELGMDVVAEGIETETQWTRLHELGCELGQGYYLARPLPAPALSAVAGPAMSKG